MTREEALDRMKRLDLNSVDREALYTIIPELRESDDERIRKMLVELAKKHLVNHERCMAESWLEKQKEQKPQVFCEAKAYDLGYKQGKEDAIKEQKPAEWSEEDERMLSRCVKSIESSKQFADSDTFKKAKDNEIDWLKNRIKSFRPIKQEWSEEDERIKSCIGLALTDVDEQRFKDFGTTLKDCLAWLKSLRPQPQGTYKLIVHNIYEMLKDKDFFDITPSHRVSLLNDIRVKCKDADECAEILDAPSWKPSEEQMALLRAVISDPNNAEAESCQLVLREIYQQFKKL